MAAIKITKGSKAGKAIKGVARNMPKATATGKGKVTISKRGGAKGGKAGGTSGGG